MTGYDTIAHLHRSNRYDTYEVWSQERLCSCVAKRPRADAPKHTAAALRLEGERLLGLVHPHIVRGYDLLDEGPTLIMETLDGETVAHLIARGALDTDEVAWLGLQVASALQYLHGRGLLHLDIKPGNLIASGGRAVVIDLSMARPPGRYKRGLGTWCNLAPEQARGDELTAAADVWGLGTVLLEAALGKPAFPQDEPEFPQLVHAPPLVPGPLGDTLAACLAFAPEDRPTLPELAAALLPHAPGARPWNPACAATC
jgi:serine/threonine protein kinase